MSICHLYIFFGEVTIKVFDPFLNWIVCFLPLSFESSLYILDNSFISEASFENIFSYSVSSLLILLKLPFSEEKF